MEYVEDEFTSHRRLKIKFRRNHLVRKDENCFSRLALTGKKHGSVPQQDFPLGIHTKGLFSEGTYPENWIRYRILASFLNFNPKQTSKYKY